MGQVFFKIINLNRASFFNSVCFEIPLFGGCSTRRLHGDFLPGNILVQNNRLSAVIDFSDLGMGDPACDLIIAWSLLNKNSRGIFRSNLENVDDDTWERGRGWALSIALIILPYYKDSNPTLTALARRMIDNVQSNY